MSEIAERRTKREEEAKLIEHMLCEVEASFEDSGRINSFIESLREQFDETKSLSEKQTEALRKFYDAARSALAFQVRVAHLTELALHPYIGEGREGEKSDEQRNPSVPLQ